MKSILLLGGPAHLNLVQIQDGAPEFVITETPHDGDPLVQSFVYKRSSLRVGTHPPVEFLIPSHMEGNPADVAGWIFNQLVQALMSRHELGGQIALTLGFAVKDHDSERVIRAEVSAHTILHSGLIGEKAVDTQHHNFMIRFEDLYALVGEGTAEARIREGAHRSMYLALRPVIDKTVDLMLKHEQKPPPPR